MTPMALEDAPRSLPMMPDEEPEAGTIELDGARITQRGTNAVVDFAPGMDRTSSDDSDEHIANLCEEMDKTECDEIVDRVIENYEADLRSRKDWQTRIDQAMELLGLRDKPMEDLPFDGASAVTYPLVGEACVQFQARAIEEVFPSEGPCKATVVGQSSKEMDAQSIRVRDFMNFQMTTQDRAYFWNVDQMLFYLPLAGSAFKKTYYDPITDMVISRLVYPQDMIVPYTCMDLATAPRYTHRTFPTGETMRRLMASGFYKYCELPDNMGMSAAAQLEDSGRQMQDEADERDPVLGERDNVYTVIEQHVDLMLPGDLKKYLGVDDEKDENARPLPYVVTVEVETRNILAIRRNWREADSVLFEKRQWFTHYKYLPGLGFYGFGLLHLIGSLCESATGTLRALLDSAAFANMQGGYISDEAKLQPGDEVLAPGQYKQVKMTAEELSRAFYTPPFREPSSALSQLFGILVDTGRRFASITEENVGDAPNTGPVGTTIALIEQAGKVFSGVHRRLHVAQAEEFRLRAELNYEFLDEEYPYKVAGEQRQIFKRDFDGRVDVIPVSDPNVFSSVQRIAQAQAMIDLATQFPGKIDLDVAIERFLKAIKVPDHEELLTGRAQTIRRDPIQENMRMMVGQGAKAFVEQDHDAHIAVHMTFLQGLNDDAMPVVGPAMQAHLAEHYALKYYAEMNAQMGGMLPPPDWMDANSDEEEIPIEADTLIAQVAAQMPPMQLMPESEPAPSPEEVAQAEFAAQEERKQQAFQAEEDRKQIAFEAEEMRKDAEADGKEVREIAREMTAEERAEIRFRGDQRRQQERGRSDG